MLEAMATGCYTLAHFWDGCEEILPPENIYSTGNKLIDKVLTFHDISPESKLEKTRQMSFHCISKCGKAEIIPQYLSLIEEVADS